LDNTKYEFLAIIYIDGKCLSLNGVG